MSNKVIEIVIDFKNGCQLQADIHGGYDRKAELTLISAKDAVIAEKEGKIGGNGYVFFDKMDLEANGFNRPFETEKFRIEGFEQFDYECVVGLLNVLDQVYPGLKQIALSILDTQKLGDQQAELLKKFDEAQAKARTEFVERLEVAKRNPFIAQDERGNFLYSMTKEKAKELLASTGGWNGRESTVWNLTDETNDVGQVIIRAGTFRLENRNGGQSRMFGWMLDD